MLKAISSLPLIFLLLVSCKQAPIAESDNPELTKKIDLLGGRLSVMMPLGSKTEERAHSIMGAPPSDQSETSVEFEHSGKKFSFTAQEMYAYSGSEFSDNFDKVLKNWNKEGSTEILRSKTVLRTKGDLEIIFIEDPENVNACVVANKDGTVQYLTVYSDDSTAKKSKPDSQFARDLFMSVQPGNATQNLKERTVTVDEYLKLSVKIPEGMASSYQIGVDFRVINCQKMKTLGEPAASFFIYSGNHPNLGSRGEEVFSESTVLGKKIKWARSAEKNSKSIETVVQVPNMPDQLLHIGISGSDPKEINEMIAAISTLKISK